MQLNFQARSGNTVCGVLAAMAVAGFLVGCSDPADDVPQASVTVPQDQQAFGGEGTEFALASGSKIGFVGSKVTGSHDGGFTNISGTIRVADGKIVGSPEFRIDMESIWSDNDRLTGHLKSADFFDVTTHPTATFTVTGLEPSGDQTTVTGNLDLHGVSKSISFPADVQVTDSEVTVNAEFAINRKDFNINYPGKPDDLIRDHVVIQLALTASSAAGR